MSTWNDPYLRELFLSQTKLIDVRSPIEFNEGSLPNSINLPIMNNEERKLVGTCYKEQGPEAAIKLGHELVSGEIKNQRIQLWIEYLKQFPNTQVFCFRGGLRSQISCQWIKENGIEKTPIPGGFKRMRQFFLSQLEEAPLPKLFRLGGFTGSGKTTVLQEIKEAIDLEGLASHRGSAFGDNGVQPSQVRFENELALELMKVKKFAIVEDESSYIGKIAVPKRFFTHMRNSPVLILKTENEERVKNIFKDYVDGSNYPNLSAPLARIQKSLGGLRHSEVHELMRKAFERGTRLEDHSEWISRLLDYYYDPLYLKDLKKQTGLILYEGTANEILDFIKYQGTQLSPFQY